MPKSTPPSLVKKRAKRYRKRRAKPKGSFGRAIALKKKPLALDPNIKQVFEHAARNLGTTLSKLLRVGLIRFIHELPTLFVMNRFNFRDYHIDPVVRYPTKNFKAKFKPEVDSKIGARLHELADKTKDIVKAGPAKLNASISYELDVRMVEHVRNAAHMLNVEEPNFIRMALVRLLKSLPELYTQRGGKQNIIAYDDAVAIAISMYERGEAYAREKGVTRKGSYIEQYKIRCKVEEATWEALVTDSLHVLNAFVALKPQTDQEKNDIEERRRTSIWAL